MTSGNALRASQAINSGATPKNVICYFANTAGQTTGVVQLKPLATKICNPTDVTPTDIELAASILIMLLSQVVGPSLTFAGGLIELHGQSLEEKNTFLEAVDNIFKKPEHKKIAEMLRYEFNLQLGDDERVKQIFLEWARKQNLIGVTVRGPLGQSVLGLEARIIEKLLDPNGEKSLAIISSSTKYA
jgi:hypothetical protein